MNDTTFSKTKTQKNGSKITIIILAILLAVLAFFAYKNYINNKESEENLIEQKLQIQSELDAKIAELDSAIAENTTIGNELEVAKQDMIVFRDSVKNLKSLNYRVIRRYKDKLAVLEASNKKLLHIADSLKIANYNISIERDSAQATVERQTSTIETQLLKNDSLSTTNIDLSEKVIKGAALHVSDVTAIAMKERSGGKLKETTRASRADAFRISFKIRANAIAEAGLKKAHIVIQNAAGNVLSAVDSFTDLTGVDVQYSDTTDVDYINEDIEVITVTTISEDNLEKGNYYIKVYLENRLLGATKVNLK